ncbi:extracellular solute-binding protein [Oceanibium sediminis]|uniref:extracellular solute-binding protein n=1 Tax=Oceanibium sediminis TaxID=2026339 RepID=UPI000DD480C3|nr:extracellular solute-binding protein [Oceanibium sediminis]
MLNKKITRTCAAAVTAMGIALGASGAAAQDEDWAQIEAAAKEEGALLVYSTTSRTAKAAENFSAMTGINVEVVRLGEQDLIQRTYQESVAGVHDVDMVVAEDWVAARELLANPGYMINYVPPTARELFAEEDKDPLVLGYIGRVFGYNTEKHPDADPLSSVWDLTTEEFRGRVMIRDVAITGEHQNALTEWVRRSDELAADYERRFGKPLEMTEDNAGLEFIKRFLENDAIIMTSDTKISEAVGAPGQDNPPYGMFYVYSKHRDAPLQGLKISDSRAIQPTLGYYYPIVLQLSANAKHPNAAKVFMEYLSTMEGFAPWADSPGVYSPNPNQVPFEGDMPLSWWKEKMWHYDRDFAAENRGIVLDTWLKYAQR